MLRHYQAHIPADEDDGQGVEELRGLSLVVTEKEPDDALQAAEDSTEKKEPDPPRLWTAEQWEEFRRQSAELAKLIGEKLRERRNAIGA